MWLVVLGVVLLALKVLGFGPFGGVPWWLVLAPFGVAVVWWKFADATGITQRQAMERQDRRARERRQRQFEALGLRATSDSKPPAGKPARDRQDRPGN